MGNDILRVDSSNIGQMRELTGQAHEIVRYTPEEASIWAEFDPMILGSSAIFTMMLQRKEFKNIKTIGLSFAEKYGNTRSFVKLNEINHLAENLGIKDPNSIAQAQKDVLLNEINKARKVGAISGAEVTKLSKQYYKLLDSQLTKSSFIEKGLTKTAILSPKVGGSLLNAYKTFKVPMFLMEIVKEIPDVLGAFKIKDKDAPNQSVNIEAGCMQIAKSAGRVAVGSAGFVAGAAIGGQIGAAVGSVVPVVGTFVGGLLGSIIGFAVGSVGSGLARKAYNSVIKSEVEIAKDNAIKSMYDVNDKSNFAKETLTEELNYHNEYITSAQNNKNPDEKVAENIAAVQSNYAILKNLYKTKFGKEFVAQATEQQTPIETTQAVPEKTIAQTTPTQTGVSNYQIAQGNLFNPSFGSSFNQNFIMNTPTVDWSARLPMNLQTQYFNAVC